MTPIAFSIRYSVGHDHEQAALALARRLFAVYDTGIDALTLVPDEEGDFALYFNDRPVISLRRDGREPTVADVRGLFAREGIVAMRRPGPEEGLDDDDLDAE